MTGVTVRVPAKLNLQLAVGPPRADGYHDLVTVFHAVSLFDEVTAEPAGRDGVTVTGEGADRVPADSGNLALRAVAALRTAMAGPATGFAVDPGGVHITIAKRIPVAAGWPAAAPTQPPPSSPATTCGTSASASSGSWRSPPGWAATWPSRCSAGPRWAAAVASG